MQEDAVKHVVACIRSGQPLTYLAGYAGSGKSSILPFILEALGYAPEKVWFAAPTAQAAKVMRSKLKAQKYPKHETTTCHSAIYRARPAPIATLESDLANHDELLAQQIASGVDPHKIETQKKLVSRLKEELHNAYREDKINFQLNPDSPVQLCDLIVIDEASMVGATMRDDLMSFGVPILAMGDPGQLPPVEDKVGLTAGKPDFFLSEIHRQALDNPIIWLSMLAREGKELPHGKHGTTVEVMLRKSFQEVYTDINTRPTFLVGMNKTRWATNQLLRQDFGFVQKAGDWVGPKAGEPLIIKKNIREYPNLVNGTHCRAISSAELVKGQAKFQLSFEDDEETTYNHKDVYQGLFEEHFLRKQGEFTAPLPVGYRARKNSIVADWGFACTVHSFQGSQADDVVLIDESSVFRQDARKFLYTGITRAAETLKVLVP